MSAPCFMLDEHVWAGLTKVGDFAPLAAEWFLAGREHWGIIIVPGQTDRSLMSLALASIHGNHSAEEFKNTFRFIQDFA